MVTRWLRCSLGVVVAACGLAASVVVATAGPDDAAKRKDSPPPGIEPPGLGEISAQEREAAIASVPAEDRAGLRQILDAAAADRMPVVDRTGELRGYITGEALHMSPARSVGELAPVTDDAGKTVGYWGGELGFVEIHQAEDPAFDLRALREEVAPPELQDRGAGPLPE